MGSCTSVSQATKMNNKSPPLTSSNQSQVKQRPETNKVKCRRIKIGGFIVSGSWKYETKLGGGRGVQTKKPLFMIFYYLRPIKFAICTSIWTPKRSRKRSCGHSPRSQAITLFQSWLISVPVLNLNSGFYPWFMKLVKSPPTPLPHPQRRKIKAPT